MTRARFPVRVRLTVTAERLTDPDVTELVLAATDAALRRAVEHARGLHVVTNALAGDPLSEPSIAVSLSGDPLPDAVARRLSAQLAGLARVNAARLLARPGRATDGGGRAPTGADETGRGERFDDGRLVIDARSTDSDTYLVPSYDMSGGPAAVKVTGQPPVPPQPVRTHPRLKIFASQDALSAALVQRYGAAVPSRLVTIVGAVGNRGQLYAYGIYLTAEPTGRILSSVDIGPISAFDPSEERWRRLSLLQADTMRHVAEGATLEQRQTSREEELFRRLREGASASVSDASLHRQAAALARHVPDRGPSRFYRILAGGQALQLLEVHHVALPAGDIPVAVFSEEVPDAPRTATGGEARGVAAECPSLPLEELLLFEPDPAHAFLGEPPVETWPPGIAGTLGDLIDDIAGRLNLPSGRFPAMFALAAVQKIRQDALRLGALAGSGEGGESPRLTDLRRMAGAFEPLHRLESFYARVIAGADEGGVLACPLRGNSASFLLHFYEEYFSRRNYAVTAMFGAACQDVLLDILENSHREIVRRQANFDAYMRVTRVLILMLLVDVTELTQLRDALNATEPGWADVAAATAGGPIGAWYEAGKTLVAALSQPPVDPSGPPQRGRVAVMADRKRVQDSVGRWWSRAELDSVIGGGREQAFAVDPLLEKLADLPDTVTRLRTAGAAGIDDEFMKLLGELKTENERRTRDARDDPDIAFGLATVSEAEITSASSIGGTLSGIHKIADERLRPLFIGGGSDAYVAGMRFVVSAELGKESLSLFLNIVGVAAIAVLCPPAAFLIGATQAVYGLSEAFEHRGLQRAMLGGGDVLSKAQVEAELWGAAIGAALVFIPEVPSLVRGASTGVRAVVKGEVREVAAATTRSIASAAGRHLAELAATSLAKSFAKACLTAVVINYALQHAIGRFTNAIAYEVQVSGHASVVDLPRLVSAAIAGPPGGER